MRLRTMIDQAPSLIPESLESSCRHDRIDEAAIADNRKNAFPYFIKQLKVRFLLFKNFTYIIVDRASRQVAIIDPSWEFENIASAID